MNIKIPHTPYLFPFLFLCLFLFPTLPIHAETTADTSQQEMTAQKILERSENTNKPKDQSSTIKMTLIDNNNEQKTRDVQFWTKGDTRRLIKFLSPADVKDVGFLSLDPDTPEENMYLYLPAFKKVRRIAGSSKSGSFMGSDFSYDDIGSTTYSGNYTAARMEDQNGQFVLKLTKKEGAEVDYDQIITWISQESFVLTRAEFYALKHSGDKTTTVLTKIMNAEEIKNIKGYQMPVRISMEDVKKNHKTILEMSKIVVDSGIPEDFFTTRYLQR